MSDWASTTGQERVTNVPSDVGANISRDGRQQITFVENQGMGRETLYFLGGAHGAGKTELSRSLAALLNIERLSASELIRSQGIEPSLQDKRVRDIDTNQQLLLTALRHRPRRASTIVLDGHFCVRDSAGQPTPISFGVFEELGPSALLCLVGDPERLTARLEARDGVNHQIEIVEAEGRCERRVAESVSAHLGVPLKVLQPPNALANALAFLTSLDAKAAN